MSHVYKRYAGYSELITEHLGAEGDTQIGSACPGFASLVLGHFQAFGDAKADIGNVASVGTQTLLCLGTKTRHASQELASGLVAPLNRNLFHRALSL